MCINDKIKIARWLDFAKRIVNVMVITPERKEKLITEIEAFIAIYDIGEREITGWDTPLSNGDMCVGDLFDAHFEEYEVWDSKQEDYTGKFHNQLSCAIRSGIDITTQEWGGGVFGFDVGDIRKMYDGRIPLWVSKALHLSGLEKNEESLWL